MSFLNSITVFSFKIYIYLQHLAVANQPVVAKPIAPSRRVVVWLPFASHHHAPVVSVL